MATAAAVKTASATAIVQAMARLDGRARNEASGSVGRRSRTREL
ncbi:hypothetical protein [Actinomyces denticolens]|nr:hypothetical protein [Actinomyces denticolens]